MKRKIVSAIVVIAALYGVVIDPAFAQIHKQKEAALVAPGSAIAFVGDSNIVRGAGVTTNMLLGGPMAPENSHLSFITSFWARPGMTLNVGWWQSKLNEPSFKPEAVVLNIGVNDTFDTSNYDGRIDAFMNSLPDVPVFWPGYPIDIEPVGKQAGLHIVNHAWAMAANRWPNLTIVPWGSLANSHPEWMDTSDPPVSRVHYTQDGYVALTNLLLEYLT